MNTKCTSNRLLHSLPHKLLLSMLLLVSSMHSHADDFVQTVDNGSLIVSHQAQQHDELPPAQLGISPPRIVSDATTRADHAITFYNYDDNPKTMELTLIDTDEHFNPIDSTAQTLKAWTIFAPKDFSVQGYGHQTMRLSFRLPSDFPKKTHYALLSINQHIDNPIVSQTGDMTTVKLGSQYFMPIVINVHE
ncbi:cellulose biosynthesis cyclic di-GMP-binding regulatory protein BcsB [Moraxella nasovis]|uniref:cellulose biosynthesis cyclic di-GMP-binding regulatory protein BcsB n=1 Tax=Moraxella nasovis TaxID=2904121 RepID=UPI001F606588|nr:cellulose biosynthesis cyclic di-GMP-binding regulatory protein BcsB [Moraxella nasovis]UNU72810.1 cellulose biosynthesis cyclic di-GMP-binding regulatory protein BcsB [Moraxella nasovis]